MVKPLRAVLGTLKSWLEMSWGMTAGFLPDGQIKWTEELARFLMGDKVSTKQEIGEVFTNPSNGETILSFTISKGFSTENPGIWIYKM